MRGALQRLGCVLEPHASPPESRVVAGIDGFDRALDLADIGLHRRTACEWQLARNEIDGLDAVSSFVNRRDAPVAVVLRRTGLFDVTHAAMNLHAKGCDLVADVGRKCLGNRREQRSAFVGGPAGRLVGAALCTVKRDGGGIGERTRRARERAHCQQHALDVGMRDDGACAGLRAGRSALLALARVGERLLGGALGDRDALQRDRQAGMVHHRDHAGHAMVLFTDDEAGGAAAVAVDHGAGRGGVNAELVLDRMRADIVACAERAVGIGQEFGHEEERNALRSRGCVGEPPQHQMHDVVGEIVLAIGDEDFLSADAITAVGRALGPRAQGAHVGAGLRLGELHGAHPFAGNELGEISALELLAAVRRQRIDRRHSQNRAEAERHGGRVPHFQTRGVERMWKILAAPLRRRGKRVPATFGPGVIRLLPSRWRRHGAVVEARAVAVTDHIERSEDVGRELACFREHRLDHVIAEIAIEAVGQRRGEIRRVIERKGNIGNRRPVSHRCFPDGTLVFAAERAHLRGARISTSARRCSRS